MTTGRGGTMSPSPRTRFRQALALPALGLGSLPVYAQVAGEGPRFYHHGWDWGWGHMVFGGLMMLLFWGGIILLVVLGVRWLGRGPESGSRSRNTALEILEERFARGEIDKEEFEERKRTLSR